MPHRLDVRLTAHEHQMLQDLRAALATPLLPTVTTSDALRAGLRELHARMCHMEARA